MIGFEVDYPTIKGKAVAGTPSAKYQVRIGHEDNIINLVFTLVIVKPFCRYGVGRTLSLRNEVFYRIEAPECTGTITRIWADNLPKGLSINSEDGSIQGVVNENTEKVATIYVNYADNNQTLTFKTGYSPAFTDRFQIVYYDGDVGQSFSCGNGYNSPDQFMRFFNGFYENENKRAGPFPENMPGDNFKFEIATKADANETYNYRRASGYHGVYGYLHIEEEGSYVFKVKGDDCCHFYFFGIQPKDRGIATKIYYEQGVSPSYYLYPGYYPIYLMLGFDGTPNGYEFWYQKDNGDTVYVPLDISYTNPQANIVDKLSYADAVRKVQSGVAIPKPNEIVPSFEGYCDKYSIKGDSALVMDEATGHYTGTITGCPKITYGVVKGETGTSSSSFPIIFECEIDNYYDKNIAVSYYKAESITIQTFVDPSSTATYIKRLTKDVSNIQLEDSLLEETNVAEWRGSIFGNGEKTFKISCKGACYARISTTTALTLSVFGSDSDKTEGTATLSGLTTIVVVFYKTDDTGHAFSFTVNDAELTDSGDVYIARNVDKEYMRTPITYADIKVGSSQTITISHYGDQEPDSYSIEPSVSGLSISSSGVISFTPTEALPVRSYVYIATLNGYEFRNAISLASHVVYTSSKIEYDNVEFSGRVGEEVNIKPTNNDGCAFIYSDTALPSGLSVDSKTGIISGHYMEAITKDINIICDTYDYKTETGLSFIIDDCENGGEIIHAMITAGPNPSTFTDAVFITSGVQDTFADKENKLPYEEFHYYVCVSGSGSFIVNSNEDIKGTYLIERGYGAFVKRGTYQGISGGIAIDTNDKGAPVPYYTESSLDDDNIGTTMTFYTNVQTTYYLKVGGSGAITFTITPDLRIAGLTIDEYGTISGMATTVQEKVYTLTAINHDEETSEIQFTIEVKDCDKVSVNVYFPFIGSSYDQSSSKNDGFRFKQGETYLLYQDGTSTTKSTYPLCLKKGSYVLEFTSTNDNGWVDSYLRLYVNGKETFNAIYTKGSSSSYTLNLETYITETSTIALTYTDFITNDGWKNGISASNAIANNIYRNEIGDLNNHYAITRYYNYEFKVNTRSPIYRITLHYEYGVAMYVNGLEIYREFLSAGNLTAGTTCTGQKATTRVIDIPSALLKTGTNVFAVELHRNAMAVTDAAAADTFRIDSLNEMTGLDNCYNLILSDAYSTISDSSMVNILDAAKHTTYSGTVTSDTTALTISFKNFVAINHFILRGTDSNPPTSLAATARLGSTSKTIIKSRDITFDETQSVDSIATEVSMPIESLSLRFGVGVGGLLSLADFIPRYCIGYCLAVTEGGFEWPAATIGDTVELSCGVGYTGTRSRLCNANGEYETAQGTCNPAAQAPVFKYTDTKFTLKRTGNTQVIDEPTVTGVAEGDYSFSITPDIKTIFPDMDIDPSTGRIYGSISPSYTSNPTTEPPTTQKPTTQEPTTQAPTTDAPTTDAPAPDERRNRNRNLDELIHVITQEFEITCVNIKSDDKLSTTQKITIVAEDPKCDAIDGYTAAYVGEEVQGIRCPAYMSGKVVRKCEYDVDTQVASFSEEDTSVCTYDAIRGCIVYSNFFIYSNVINRFYSNGWTFVATKATDLTCYLTEGGSQTMDCPDWLELHNNGSLIAERSETFEEFYVTYGVANPNTTTPCKLKRFKVLFSGKAIMQPIAYEFKEYNYTLSDTLDGLIKPSTSLSGLDYCVSDPAFPAGITFNPDYQNHGGRIIVRAIGPSAGTYTITCGNRESSNSVTISINVDAPSCSDANYGILEIGGTKTIGCGVNKKGKIVVYCNDNHEYVVQENTCTDAKPTRLAFNGGKVVYYYVNVMSTPKKVDHDGDIGVATFSTKDTLEPGLSVHPYLGYLIGTPTRVQQNAKTAVISITQDQTVNATLTYVIIEGYCTYMGKQIPPGESYIGVCGEGESGSLVKRCPSQPSASGGFVLVDVSVCKKMKPVTFVYSSSSIVLKVGTAMAVMQPTFSSLSTFSVEPALPNGITVNNATGVISGIPTDVQEPTKYTFYAEDEWKHPFEMTIRIVDKTCPQRDGFPETPIGSISTIPCTNGNDGNEKRKCNEDQTWDSEIDQSECTDAEPELIYPATEFSFFVNVAITPILYTKSINILSYVADELPDGLSINEVGTISGTPLYETPRQIYEITGITRSSAKIIAYVSIAITGSFCAANGGFENTPAGETVYKTCTESTTWGMTSRKCLGPEETGTDAAEWEAAIECNKTEAVAGRKEYEFSFNITNVPVDYMTLEYYNAVYNVVYRALAESLEDDISSLMYVANTTDDNKLVYTFYIFSEMEQTAVTEIIGQLVLSASSSIFNSLVAETGNFFTASSIEASLDVTITTKHIPNTENNDEGPNLAMIIGIAGGCVVLILIIIVCVICCRMRSAKQSTFSREVPKAKKAARA